MSGFGVLDYAVVGLMLAVSSGIGLFYRFSGGKQRTKDEYLHGKRLKIINVHFNYDKRNLFNAGNHTMGVLPVAFSLMATFMSAITLLGVTRENYSFGTQFLAINLAYIIATPLVTRLYLPVFFRLQTASVYKYLELRFGPSTRLLASLAFSLQMFLYMGIVLYAPALALSAVTGLNFTGSILAVGAVCTFYSTLGGMKAILVTDVFQSLLMFAAVFAAGVAGSLKVGGPLEVIRIASERERLEFFNLSPDLSERHTLWTQVIGGTFIYLSIYGVNQAQIQRLLTIGDLDRSQRSLWLQLPILMTLSFSTAFAGLAIFAFFRDCDPVLAMQIKKDDQLLPHFVVKTMGAIPGLSGLFVAGIFSGSLSTVSSAINSLAAVTLEDYIRLCTSQELSDSTTTLILKFLAAFYGLACVVMAFMADMLGPGVLQASLTIFGVVGGPLLGLFTLGMAFPRANSIGSNTGLLSALSFLLWIGFSGPKPAPEKLPLSTEGCLEAFNITVPKISDGLKPLWAEEPEYFYLFTISYAWYALIGFVICLSVGVIVSEVANKFCRLAQFEERTDPDLFWTFVRDNVVKDSLKVTQSASAPEKLPLEEKESPEEKAVLVT